MTLRKLNCDTIQFHEYKCLNIFIWMLKVIYSWNKNHNTQTFLAVLVSWVWVSALIRFSYSGWRVVVFCSGTADGWHWSNSDGTEGGDRDQGDTGHWTVSLQSHRWEHLTITNIVCVSHLDHEQPVSRRRCLVQVQPLSGREADPRQEHLGAPHHHCGGVSLVWTQKWVSQK